MSDDLEMLTEEQAEDMMAQLAEFFGFDMVRFTDEEDGSLSGFVVGNEDFIQSLLPTEPRKNKEEMN